jgi:glycosyltransferase involved in cell wall biosynthesis
MNILFISNIFPPHVRGGYELGCLELARAYQSKGHTVVVASSETPPSLRSYPAPKDLDVRYIFLPIKYYDSEYNKQFEKNFVYLHERTMAFGGYLEANCIALQRLIEIENPDLVWIFNPLGLGPLGIFEVCIANGKKILVHLMDNLDGVILDHSKVHNFEAKWKTLKQQITAISCSHKMLVSNSRLGNYGKHEVIYNWVDLAQKQSFQMSADNSETTSSASSSHEKFSIVYFGQLNAKKGILFIYELAKKILESPFSDKISIQLYGKGDLSDWLETNLEQNSAVKKILTLRGFIEKAQLFQELKNADLAFFPLSDEEPFGYAPVEAIMQGLPVVLTEGVGCAELFKDQEEIILIKDRTNIDELYEKVAWCFNNQDKLELMQERAMKVVAQKCDLSSVTIPKLDEVISKLEPTMEYSFDHVLATCELFRYPLPELESKYRLWNPRYRLADIIFDKIYGLPIIGSYLEDQEKKLVRYYKTVIKKNS